MTRRRAALTAFVMSLSVLAYALAGGIWLAGVAFMAAAYVVLVASL